MPYARPRVLRPLFGRALAGLLTLSVATVTFGSSMPPAMAADPPTTASGHQDGVPFPSALVGPVPAADVPVERAMTDVYVTPSADPDRPMVNVQFRAPFSVPSHPYRVSVVIGDPFGPRLRVSMLAAGDGSVAWKEERSSNQPAAGPPPVGSATGATIPEYDVLATQPTGSELSPTGLVRIAVPMKDAPAGADVWIEAETGTDGSQVNVSPLFSRAALFAPTPPAYPLPSSLTGWMSDAAGGSTGMIVPLPSGPTVTVANHALQVATTERPPTEMAGQKVTKVVDVLRIAPDYGTRAVVTDYVSIDRSTGEVKLIDGMSLPPTDQSGDGSWLRAGLPPGDPGAPTTVQVDLAAMVRALGIQVSGPTTAVGVRRQYVLANGNQVVSDAVLGTIDWFDPTALAGIGLPPASSDGAPLGSVADPEPSTAWQVWALAAFGATVLLIVATGLVVHLLRRRGVGIDAADELTAIAVETAEHRAITREERKLTTQDVPVVVADEAAPDEAAADPRALDDLPPPPPPPPPAPPATVAERPLVEEDDDDEDDPLESPLFALVDLTDSGRVRAVRPGGEKVDPDQALADLRSQYDDLEARLRRINSPAGRR